MSIVSKRGRSCKPGTSTSTPEDAAEIADLEPFLLRLAVWIELAREARFDDVTPFLLDASVASVDVQRGLEQARRVFAAINAPATSPADLKTVKAYYRGAPGDAAKRGGELIASWPQRPAPKSERRIRAIPEHPHDRLATAISGQSPTKRSDREPQT